MVGLHLGGDRLERGRERRLAPRRPPAAEPGAQLALLAAGEAGHGARVVGALLHEGERLQHRVVEMGGDVGPLLGADALAALLGEVAAEPQPERREDERQRDEDHDHREDDVAGGRERVVEVEEDEAAADDERGAERDAPDRVGREPDRGRAAVAGRGRGLAPDQRAADRGEHDRPHERVADPDPPLAEQQQDRPDEERHPGRHLPARAAAGEAEREPPACALAGHQQPREGVQADPEAADRRREERDAEEQRRDPEAAREPGADAADDGALGLAAQGRLGALDAHPGHVPTEPQRSLRPIASRLAPTVANSAGHR